jgi:hypothetical protein
MICQLQYSSAFLDEMAPFILQDANVLHPISPLFGI